jgi:hypothetical protein
LFADGQERIEAGHRILEYDRDVVATVAAHLLLAAGQEILAIEQGYAALDACRGFGQQVEQAVAKYRFAGTGFADTPLRVWK